MREKARQFMQGRYGSDQLGRFTMGVGAVSLIAYMFLHWNVLYFLTLFCLIAYYYRALSRNHGRRYEENLKFLQIRNRITGRFRSTKSHLEQMRYYRFYSCPTCHQNIRVPKGHGKISITCPKCRSEFIRKS
ncbi:MAG: hypothetical protein J6N77_06240 [Lachnospiraceae bacterium]|nr:hypothetical protein [Lachnospiraceae bacterium]